MRKSRIMAKLIVIDLLSQVMCSCGGLFAEVSEFGKAAIESALRSLRKFGAEEMVCMG
jgi:hypothetical protein